MIGPEWSTQGLPSGSQEGPCYSLCPFWGLVSSLPAQKPEECDPIEDGFLALDLVIESFRLEGTLKII